MASSYELKASARDRVGKGAARALRREGLLPAVIYGDKKPALPITIPVKETTLTLHKGGFLINIGTIDIDGEKHQVIAKDFQLHPVRDDVLHVDFLRVSGNTTLTVDIPVTFINEETCPGLKKGGMLNVVRHTVELIVPANAIPETLVFDLAKVEIGDTLHISATTLPEGAQPTITDRDFTVATLAAPGGGVQDDEEEAEGGEEETSE
ncbi:MULTISPECIES: 50S ribosomal protein L25/general stress protein Ctc [Stappiaceae]|jgi:large subunit ribosomal protein L25|uniref:50S ribosomal protein L25/general stress protein Ctc n=1 Tax=Stappiaceae TaxID=2821832 RepID=UPI00092704A6|nr:MULTISPECIES: 50S ribosomal protein L25/general stress protein Ctc [Stappiaceae]MBO9425580.1 50S ribosomal protein L25/general stress protein Ctc [Labrenzia sp. R4_1]OJJ10798.1 50S ribosomal protein L25/general stress protein Ctc [Alphaproteobacteria bacterium AO1-B]